MCPVLALAQAQPAQSQPSEQSQQDVVYTADEYAAYQKAVEEPDPAKREDAIVAFIKANPKSSLIQYAVGGYLQLLQEYSSAGEMAKLAGAGEKLLSVRPEDVSVMYQTGVAFFKSQQFAKAGYYLEKVYEKQPEPSIAFMLAVTYGSPGAADDEKVVKYGEIACSQFPPQDCYVILTQLTRVASEKKQWAKAADMAKKTLIAFESVQKPEGVPDTEWKDYLSREKAVAFAAQGRQAFENGDWKATLDLYGKALELYDKLPGLNAEAYYHIGFAYWNLRDLKPAMKAFALGSIQKGALHAKPSLEQLERLYRSQHNDSTAGMDEYIAETTTQNP
jgi:tetratricopeptide (TPR) repeat protein